MMWSCMMGRRSMRWYTEQYDQLLSTREEVALVSISKVLLFSGCSEILYRHVSQKGRIYISIYPCRYVSLYTERGRERGGEKEREIYFFEQKLDPWKYYFDCVLTFLYPVYKIKISNKVSVVVKTFLKNEANGCTCFHFCMTA